jgi:hypothetical protein
MQLSEEPVKTNKSGIKLYNMFLSEEEFKFFQEFIWDKYAEEGSKHIDNYIKKAKELKNIAKELYPNNTFEVYVEKDTKQIHINAQDVCSSVNVNMVLRILEKYNNKDVDKKETRERIYIN